MRVVKTFRVSKTIRLPQWDEQTKQKVIDFWQGRGIHFSDTRTDVLRGRRGSLWGNLTSFDMSKLVAHLTISASSPALLECVMEIDGRYQDLTDWNEAYWHLEMETLESYLLTGDQKGPEWRQFQRDSRAAAWQWSLSGTKLGRKLPPKP